MDYGILANVVTVVVTVLSVVFGVRSSVSNVETKLDNLKEIMTAHQRRLEAAHERIDKHVLDWHKK